MPDRDIVRRLLEYMQRRLKQGSMLGPDDEIFDVVHPGDSLFALELMFLVEREFSVKLSDEDMDSRISARRSGSPI